MNAHKAGKIIRLLSILALVLSLLFRSNAVSSLLIALCALAAVILLYRYLPELSNLSSENPRNKTLRMITIGNILLLAGCLVLILLSHYGVFTLSEKAISVALPLLFAGLIILFGNQAPKIPFNPRTGLRLPWTVSDEDTWIVAHRLLGYLSLPCGILCFAGLADPTNPAGIPTAMLLIWILIPSVLSGLFFWRKYHPKK